MSFNYLRWSQVAYAGERTSPKDGVTPNAGSWPLFYFSRDQRGFLTPEGDPFDVPVADPNHIPFEQELQAVHSALANADRRGVALAEYYGTGVPTKQWTPVADRLIDTYGVTPVEAARILAVLHQALQDTMVVVWAEKYKWDVARPNQYDQELRTLLCTPRFPAYPSGHSALSGCAEEILSYFFPGERRPLHQVAEDNALSRLIAGVHFPADNTEGLKLGRTMGHFIVQQLHEDTDAEGRPVDRRFHENLQADIFPRRYEQFIPFEFPKRCSSLVETKSGPEKEKNEEVAKPKLYI
ncbi:PAP2 superfamily protein [Salsuginibacillus halophilus]|uniref:PAP2 superfamily protein n=1 Tax=Salsuginibacillus halophilus TaxID=517424 RepID=A0A2P8H918_9BACI|nr:phosphatase PAP2 family protein [Salsuginibacillus halophilus]PSL42727.1 PAP2 superfamily protein [Salsuginibacillus halophilus]